MAAVSVKRSIMHLFSMSDFIDTEPKQQRNSYLMLIEYSDPHFFFHHFVKSSIFFKKRKNQRKSKASFLARYLRKGDGMESNTHISLLHQIHFSATQGTNE